MKIIFISCSVLYFIMNVAGCHKGEPEPVVVDLRLSASFLPGDSIPVKYSCKVSQQTFPAISWAASSKTTSSYVLIMDDPDAIPVAGKVWNHWVLYNIPSGTRIIPEGQDQYGPLPVGTFRGTTSFGDTAYGGPCPPAGQKHTYVFTLYGLDKTDLGLPRAATSAQVRAAMKGHILDSSVYKGTFIR